MNQYRAERKTEKIIVLATPGQKERIRRMSEKRAPSMGAYVLEAAMLAVESDEADEVVKEQR